MQSKSPKISVLMPVYNCEKYLATAIESILKQTFIDFEFLIINDGSTDKSEKIIKSYSDKRIRYKKNEDNLGIIRTLNKGIDLAKGKYIVRMDGDDISLPKRLQIQFDFMENNKEIGVAGSRTKTIGKIKGFSSKSLSNPKEIKANLIFNTPFAHPSVIIKKSILDEHNLFYDENFTHAEDYELWTRIAKISKLTNINKVLLLYRMHDASICNTHPDLQRQMAKKIRIKELNNLNIEPSEEELFLHQSLKKTKKYSQEEYFDKLEKWLKELIDANQKTQYYDHNSFIYIIKKRWLNVCYANTNLGIWILRRFYQSKFSGKLVNREKIKITKLIIKSIISS